MPSGFESTIWNYLYKKIGNAYGVAGLMGNLYHESNLYPDIVQGDIPRSSYSVEYTAKVDSGAISKNDFVHNGPGGGGYGLAQWTYYSRKQALYEKWKSGGYSSIGSIDLALDYLYFELENNYPGVLSVLKSATSVRTASDKVLHDFENPEDQSEAVEKKRAETGTGYYNQFANGGGGSGATFTPRLNSDGIEGEKYWYSGSPFYTAGYGLPNCTCYAWGRFWEISDKSDGTKDYSSKPTLPTSDAGTWFSRVTGYDTGKTPKLGAVICWGDNSGGAGHVAIVEKIDEETGDIVTSNSAWNSTFFYTKTIYAADGYSFSGYTFQGFIYNPHVATSTPTDPEDPDDPEDPEIPDDFEPEYDSSTPYRKRKGYKFFIYNAKKRRMRNG